MTDLAPPRPGWYPDPWGVHGTWRWWDGRMWTPQTAAQGPAARRPRLPAWLSPPLVVAAVPMVPIILLTTVTAPLSLPLGMVPLLIVAPALLWLDRVEPEPRQARLHAFLWGALVATGVSLLINSLVAAVAGEVLAAVVSAPVVEEATKAGAVLYALRRREVDGVMDGLVYAGWSALGFAVVEDVFYLAASAADGSFVVVFVLRALLSPFAHPLFTAWIGLAVGWAVSRNRSVGPAAAGGYVLAVGTHALWNGSLVGGEEMGAATFLLVAIVIFVILFIGVAIATIRLRRQQERRFVQLIPWLAQRYGMAPQEVALHGTFSEVRRTRRGLGGAQRQRFDAVHGALARLAQLHDRTGGPDPQTEARLVQQLQRARSA